MKIFNRTINIELLIGVCALLTSIISLGIYLEQLKISRQQQKASVYPYVWVTYQRIEDGFYFNIENKGVGPAFIKKVDIAFKGKKYTDFSTLFTQQWVKRNDNNATNTFPFYMRNVTNGDVFKIGETVEIYVLKNNDKLANHLQSVVEDSSFHFKVLYTDVYGDYFSNEDNTVKNIENPLE